MYVQGTVKPLYGDYLPFRTFVLVVISERTGYYVRNIKMSEMLNSVGKNLHFRKNGPTRGEIAAGGFYCDYWCSYIFLPFKQTAKRQYLLTCPLFLKVHY